MAALSVFPMFFLVLVLFSSRACKPAAASLRIAEEAFVEGYNQATGQWIGRTTQNRPLNFIHPEFPGPRDGATLAGKYCNVRVTRAGPNSLAGERVN